MISDDTSQKVRYALESVVTNGTGRPAFIDKYRVGGKTGTAQKVQNGRYMVGNYIVSFMGFLPADDPQVIVYIAIDNAKGVTQYGGTVAAPIARNILIDAIDALQIEEREGWSEKEYNFYDKKYIEIPNVTEMNVKEALSKLKSFKVEFTGNGNIIKYQSPSSGTRIYEGETVRLLLGD